PVPFAFTTARIIDDIHTVPYPEGVRSPSFELNRNVKGNRFRYYDRDCLLQFMSVCKMKPEQLQLFPLNFFGWQILVLQANGA
ncbi:hypothetical protein C8J56DRAFT_788166, partial [Mycena floridula]